ncbi:MAG: MATE family efflux transporter [Cytophagales bacterium]|nr:MATE family efflux transporter [Cytophagales bacterium]
MTLKEHFQKNIVLAYPVVIGQLGHIMVNVADSMMVGRVGVIPLAGATFASTIYTTLMLFGLGVSYAITPLVAAEDRKNTSALLGFLQNGFLMNLILGTILAIMGYSASFFLEYFGQLPEVVAEAKGYLRIMSVSIIPLMVFQTYRQFTEGLSDTMNPMIVSIVSNLLNIGLNWVFIFGHFGVKPMGLLGAGLATLIARILMPAMIIFLTRKNTIGFRWHFQLSGIRQLLRIGIPSGMQFIFEVGAFAGAGIMIGWMGAEELAAHNIALNLSAVSYMAATGFAAASTIRMGNQLGLKDKHNLRLAGFTSFITATAFMAFCAILFIIFRDFLPTLYVQDQIVISMASTLLLVGAAFQISDGLQSVGLGVLRGLRDVKIPTLVTFTAFWIVSIPLGYFLGFTKNLGVNGVWIALSIGLTVAAILHIWRFNVLSKRLNF